MIGIITTKHIQAVDLNLKQHKPSVHYFTNLPNGRI